MTTDKTTQKKAHKATEKPGKSREICGVEHYDVTRAAAFLGVHPSTLKRETAHNRITSLKIGRDIWYRPAWLTDYIEERTKIGVYR